MDETLCFILSSTGNADADPDNIIFTIEYETLYVPVATLSTKDNQKLSKVLSKGLKDQFIGMSVKQKVRIKIQQITTNISRIKLYRI